MIPNIFLNSVHCQEDYFSHSLAYILNLFPDIGQRLLKRISSLAEKPVDYFGNFISCEFIGHEFQESHFKSKPDLKIICKKRVIYFENKLESPLSIAQMRNHSLLVSKSKNSNIIFVSNILHDCPYLTKLHNYLHPKNSDHFLWADFLPAFTVTTRQGSLDNKLLTDFQIALRANGMIGRVIKGANDNLYTSGSNSSHNALLHLWSIMDEIGFKLTKKIKREATIRAYPLKHQVYPLLNPRFIPSAISFSDDLDKEVLQIIVWSKGKIGNYNRILKKFKPSKDCLFFEALYPISYDYDYHGSFLIPLSFNGNGKYSEINFELLRKPLKNILNVWQ
jgi:hypothetical protein